MTNPDPALRPHLVTWAYRCWVISGGLLAVLGAGYVVVGVVGSGPTLAPVGIGFLVAAVGAAIVLLGTKAFTGDERWRSSLAALTLVVVVMLLILSFVINLLALALLAAVVGLFGSLLAFRPESDAWFTGKDPSAVIVPGRSTKRAPKKGPGRAKPRTDS
ncbi:MAG: hypothetical protein QM662_04610 [Gordonia sp. (in: high G+C Gram-positive bacteria)]